MPNVCFPCATLQDADTGRIALYYGCADSYVGLAFKMCIRDRWELVPPMPPLT